MIEHPVNHLQQCVQEYVRGEFKGMSSRSVDIALNEAFEKHVDPWLDVLKTSYDGRGLREDDTPALYPPIARKESPRIIHIFYLRIRLLHLLRLHVTSVVFCASEYINESYMITNIRQRHDLTARLRKPATTRDGRRK